MITLQLLGAEAVVLVVGIIAVLLVGPDWGYHARVWAYRRHRADVEARQHIAYFERLLDDREGW